jgi:hypothetical protein
LSVNNGLGQFAKGQLFSNFSTIDPSKNTTPIFQRNIPTMLSRKKRSNKNSPQRVGGPATIQGAPLTDYIGVQTGATPGLDRRSIRRVRDSLENMGGGDRNINIDLNQNTDAIL